MTEFLRTTTATAAFTVPVHHITVPPAQALLLQANIITIGITIIIGPVPEFRPPLAAPPQQVSSPRRLFFPWS
ncbi:MAG: hypothetical protein IKF77_04550 [Thermoguttaceae bacterium]|nr:hypothetical protein [Thermoguttaceae bacterium]